MTKLQPGNISIGLETTTILESSGLYQQQQPSVMSKLRGGVEDSLRRANSTL